MTFFDEEFFVFFFFHFKLVLHLVASVLFKKNRKLIPFTIAPLYFPLINDAQTVVAPSQLAFQPATEKQMIDHPIAPAQKKNPPMREKG
ncbi:hypothetical protein DM01DRAFT_153586 [Hesseltinella vesiculosa]|uniref:Uncharacterized protein n=1 Tax=Hesseltinella vesiculosa TaxID=101127 RepID=A0A1X2GVB4_9FUNG|nr:hypothetical protein DM01DRAFT_153586 [Hesseltinella vesiculosa]